MKRHGQVVPSRLRAAEVRSLAPYRRATAGGLGSCLALEIATIDAVSLLLRERCHGRFTIRASQSKVLFGLEPMIIGTIGWPPFGFPQSVRSLSNCVFV
jgi:hypothetical protein